MEDDFYHLRRGARRNLVGRRTRRMIRLGDKVTVQVAKVDTLQKAGGFPISLRHDRAAASEFILPPPCWQRTPTATGKLRAAPPSRRKFPAVRAAALNNLPQNCQGLHKPAKCVK